jgi:hypothetical protein
MKKDIKYTQDYIEHLICEVDGKISLLSNKDYKNNIYNLGLCQSLGIAKDLITIRSILYKLTKCHSCYCDSDTEDIVAITLNKLNNC